MKWQCNSGLSERKNERLQEFRKEEMEVKRMHLEKDLRAPFFRDRVSGGT